MPDSSRSQVSDDHHGLQCFVCAAYWSQSLLYTANAQMSPRLLLMVQMNQINILGKAQ